MRTDGNAPAPMYVDWYKRIQDGFWCNGVGFENDADWVSSALFFRTHGVASEASFVLREIRYIYTSIGLLQRFARVHTISAVFSMTSD